MQISKAVSLSCFGALLLALGKVNAQVQGGFIRVKGTNFVTESCERWAPYGFNLWPVPVLEHAIWAIYGNESAKSYVQNVMQTAKAAGFNSIRFFAIGTDYDFVFHRGPGVEGLDPNVWRAIDYVIYQAGLAGLRILYVPLNFQNARDGPYDYTKWAGVPNTLESFFTRWETTVPFKLYLEALLNHKNEFTGLQYKDDPTIWGWNLGNEMRCPATNPGESACPEALRKWIADVSMFLKERTRQLVGVGYEGFFASGSGNDYASPYGWVGAGNLQSLAAFWATQTGQDSTTQSTPISVDFLTFHHWPDNWATWDFNWATSFVTAQNIIAQRLGKPAVLEEFGKIAATETEIETVKNQWYRFWLNAQIALAKAGSPMNGLMFWHWVPSDVKDVSLGERVNVLTVFTNDPTWNLMKSKAAEFKAATGGNVGCPNN